MNIHNISSQKPETHNEKTKKLYNWIEKREVGREREEKAPARTIFCNEKRITSHQTDFACYLLSRGRVRRSWFLLHPRVLGFPVVLRLKPVAALCKTVLVGMWFSQLDWQLSAGKWLRCQSCYVKDDKELSYNHCHWFLYITFFQFIQYFKCEILYYIYALHKWEKCYFSHSHLFPEYPSFTLFLHLQALQ